MHIAFASDSRYSAGLYLAVASVLEYSRPTNGICFYILDGGLRSLDKEVLGRLVKSSRCAASLEYVTLDQSRFKGMKLLQDSPLTYARLVLPELFPKLPEIIYGDVDVFYGSGLSRLWEIDCASAPAVAVEDSIIPTLDGDAPWLDESSPDRKLPYFNAGVLKINLDYWRDHRVGEEALRIAQADPDKCKYWDQTILNHLLRGKIVWAPRENNYLARPDNPIDDGSESPEGKNIHYVCRVKPWMRYSSSTTFKIWRKQYRFLLPSAPGYRSTWRFWAGYVWGDLLVSSPLNRVVCGALLATNLFRLIPGLSAEKLKAHVEGRI